MSRKKPCPQGCEKTDPLRGLPYHVAVERATELRRQGYRQRSCPKCKRWTRWEFV